MEAGLGHGCWIWKGKSSRGGQGTGALGWLVRKGGVCRDRPHLGSLTGRFTEDSIGTTFLTSWLLSNFTRFLSRVSHCVRKASENQEKALPPLRTRDLA